MKEFIFTSKMRRKDGVWHWERVRHKRSKEIREEEENKSNRVREKKCKRVNRESKKCKGVERGMRDKFPVLRN